MFVEIITGRVTDRDAFLREADRWAEELEPGAEGYLGCTWGIGTDGTGVIAARFESADAAQRNAARPEQGDWWNAMRPALDAPEFHDCTTVDTMLGGGSDDARFVQVIRGRARDEAAARSMIAEVQDRLGDARPDILGGVMAWHGDGGGFTQLMYFRSEAAAHEGEQHLADADVDQQYREMMAAPPTFIDLTDPRFD
jgi:hypothetical protein